jgi:hypothetical protein
MVERKCQWPINSGIRGWAYCGRVVGDSWTGSELAALLGQETPRERIIGLDVCMVHWSIILRRIESDVISNDHVQRAVYSAFMTVLPEFCEAERQREQDLQDRLDRDAEREYRHRNRQARTSGSVVYFVERDSFIKIGWSASLDQRLKSIGRGGSMPEGMTVGPVTLLATMPGTNKEELYLHQRFARHRLLPTEWFYPAPEVVEFIRGLKGYVRR